MRFASPGRTFMLNPLAVRAAALYKPLPTPAPTTAAPAPAAAAARPCGGSGSGVSTPVQGSPASSPRRPSTPGACLLCFWGLVDI